MSDWQTDIPEPDDTDPVGLWYRARLADNIDDRMWFGFFDDTGRPHWQTLSHRHYDGIGALAELFAARGWRIGALPAGRGRQPVVRPHTPPRPAAPPVWLDLDPARSGERAQQPPAACLLDRAESAVIDAAARAAGVGTTSWLLWTADRAARGLLVTADSPMPWLFPVNLRGAVAAARPTMNHCSGVGLVLYGEDRAADLQRQTAARLGAGEHWRQWRGLTVGRWIGAGGVRLLYRLLRAAPGRHAGSYSNLGDWPPPGFVAGGAGEPAGLVGVAPGSPGWPVSAATLRWRDRRAFACRLHPVLDRPGLAESFLHRWRHFAAGGE
ncbi:MAG: hypothetical protein ACOY33_08515 [Pseudomonadota bacterium]